MDFVRARAFMVDSQVRTADVTDPALIAAFREVPRERFTPPAMQQAAYADAEIEVAPGRFLLRPRDLAKLLQSLPPQPGARGLEIGGATGYGAGVMARAGLGAVTTLDADAALTAAAGVALKAIGAVNVRAVTGALAAGADEGPYDLIWVNGAVEVVPESWLASLGEGGRLGVIVRAGAAGSARIYTKSGGTSSYRAVFDAAPPILPGTERAAAFVF